MTGWRASTSVADRFGWHRVEHAVPLDQREPPDPARLAAGGVEPHPRQPAEQRLLDAEPRIRGRPSWCGARRRGRDGPASVSARRFSSPMSAGGSRSISARNPALRSRNGRSILPLRAASPAQAHLQRHAVVAGELQRRRMTSWNAAATGRARAAPSDPCARPPAPRRGRRTSRPAPPRCGAGRSTGRTTTACGGTSTAPSRSSAARDPSPTGGPTRCSPTSRTGTPRPARSRSAPPPRGVAPRDGPRTVRR